MWNKKRIVRRRAREARGKKQLNVRGKQTEIMRFRGYRVILLLFEIWVAINSSHPLYSQQRPFREKIKFRELFTCDGFVPASTG